MVSIVRSEPSLSLESRGGSLTAGEELNHYRQRLQSMKLVLKELQQQVVLYKTRCAGVDTVTFMLKEAKQDVMKLTNQNKALETAIANLQNRLSNYGLSNSVMIEETEMFVPGASQQIIDNLARENARLRSLLKSHEGQSGKSLEELQNMKISVEALEAENSQLRVQIHEVDNMKQALTTQFEEIVVKMKEAHEAEKLKLEQELKQHLQDKVFDSVNNQNKADVEKESRGMQTEDMDPARIDEVRLALKLLSEKCMTLDSILENAHVGVEWEKNKSLSEDNAAIITQETYNELERKFNMVTHMNQRWQAYSHSQEQQIHGLLVKISELEQLNQDGEKLRNVVSAKEFENHTLRQKIDNMKREVTKLPQPQFDVSIVEILKQQIQVCTEDFNTERKDREHAVNRAKHLQEEVDKLANENEILKREIDNLKRAPRLPEFDKRDNQMWMKYPQPNNFLARGGLLPYQRIPFSSSTSLGSSASSAYSLSPAHSPGPLFMSALSAVDRSSFSPTSSHDSIIGFQGPTLVGNRQQSSQGDNYMSLTRRRSQEGMPATSSLPKPSATSTSPKPLDMDVSVPALGKRSGDLDKTKNRQTDMTCPKCSKEFTEDQDVELVRHINSCPG